MKNCPPPLREELQEIWPLEWFPNKDRRQNFSKLEQEIFYCALASLFEALSTINLANTPKKCSIRWWRIIVVLYIYYNYSIKSSVQCLLLIISVNSLPPLPFYMVFLLLRAQIQLSIGFSEVCYAWWRYYFMCSCPQVTKIMFLGCVSEPLGLLCVRLNFP